MLRFQTKHNSFHSLAGKSRLLVGLLLIFVIAGCGTKTNSIANPPDTSTASQPGPRSYFAPYVAGTTNANANTLLTGPKIYVIDDSANKFSQSIFGLPQGPQVINAGKFNVAQRGLLSLIITANYINTGAAYMPTNDPPKGESSAIELANQAGGFVQLVGQPVSPLVAALQCPVMASAQTWQFLTIPGGLYSSSADQITATWNPTTDTAYGSVDISSDGTNVTLNNILQHTLPSVGGSGAPAQQPSSSVSGLCGPTVFGNTISVPGQLVIQNPGVNTAAPPQATVGIGPSGLLVEHNGAGDPLTSTLPNTSPALTYNNVLGAGTGAVGLPKPSSALDPNALRSAQYLGFVYGAGVNQGNPQAPPTGWSSHLVSFGFLNTPSSCGTVAPASSTMIYGGDFTNDDPSTAASGFGNCDLAIDLGTEDSKNNGLFTQATVWLGAGYAANTAGKSYSFSAVALAGQLNGKYAIFLLGVDSVQPWAIYLLQSN